MPSSIASPSGPTEHLVAALTSGDTRLQTSFGNTLDRAIGGSHAANERLRSEELEALAALAAGLGSITDPVQRNALRPTLRHLLARVLR